MRFEKTFPMLLLAGLSLISVIIMTGKTAIKSDLATIDPKKPPDFLMYYNGATIARNNGIKSLYDIDLQKSSWDEVVLPHKMEGLLAFRAPPIVALMLKPMAGLSYTSSYLMLLAFNAVVIGAVIIIYKLTKTINTKVWYKILFVLPLFVPLWMNIHSGQISTLILLFVSLAYLHLTRDNLFAAGLWLGIVFIKPQYLTLLPLTFAVYLRHKNFKNLVAGTALSLTLMLIINILLYGPNFITEYPVFLLTSESSAQGTNPFFNYNISSFLSLFLVQHQHINIANMIINSALYIALIISLIKHSVETNKDLAFAAVVMFGPLLNLHTMPVDIVVFLLSMYIACTYFYKKGEIKKMRLFLALMLVLPWVAFFQLMFVTTLMFMAMGYWILKESFGGDGGNRTPVLKA